MPNYFTVENAGKVPPLTTEQKFKLVTRSSFDLFEYFWYGALAAISQAKDGEPGYGQGASGYAKRYGSQFADGTIENYMTKAVLPSVLHQDPRYYRLGQGGFWHRMAYSVSRTFVTRSDAGQTQFNYSEIVGGAVAGGISAYTYHPRGDRDLPDVVSVWGTQVGYDALGFVIKEFWPDIRHRLRKDKSVSAVTAQ
jgi:hypothetical protein